MSYIHINTQRSTRWPSPSLSLSLAGFTGVSHHAQLFFLPKHKTYAQRQ